MKRTCRSSNVSFALTVGGALVAILAANLTREYHPELVVTCGLVTSIQLGALLMSRRQPVLHFGTDR